MGEGGERGTPPKPGFLSGSLWETRKHNLRFQSWRPGPRHDAVCPAEGALAYQKGICFSNSTEWISPSDLGISVFCFLCRSSFETHWVAAVEGLVYWWRWELICSGAVIASWWMWMEVERELCKNKSTMVCQDQHFPRMWSELYS